MSNIEKAQLTYKELQKRKVKKAKAKNKLVNETVINLVAKCKKIRRYHE